jgi:hypothetical protein
VVLGVNVPEGESVTLQGQQVPRAHPSGQRYLGAMFDDKATPATVAKHRAQCLQSAFRAAMGTFNVHVIHAGIWLVAFLSYCAC